MLSHPLCRGHLSPFIKLTLSRLEPETHVRFAAAEMAACVERGSRQSSYGSLEIPTAEPERIAHRHIAVGDHGSTIIQCSSTASAIRVAKSV